MTRVLITDELSPRAVDTLQRRDIVMDLRLGIATEDLIAALGDYDGLIVRSATKVTADVLRAGTRLRVVGRAGVGVDNIDVAVATQRGVVVMNTPSGNAVTTAEHAIAMMLALVRQVPAADASMRAGKWEKERFVGTELAGKTLGIIGCGNIGSIVAERAHGLKMKVVTYDPYLSPARAIDMGVEKVDLDALLARADVVSLHVPKTSDTQNMIDSAAIAKTRPGVRIINCARGGLVAEADLIAALRSGHVGGAALDVFEHEPATDNPLCAEANVICTPHLGASTAEAQENVAVQVAEQVADYLLTGAVTNAVNMPAVSAEEAPHLRPYMLLARQLGSFAGQLTESGISAVTIEYEGHAASLNIKPITAAALMGLLQPQLETVNMVNAPGLAHERGIATTETQHDRPCDYQSLIRLTVTTENQTRGIAGTLFGGDKPRIVNVKGISLEAELTPSMLYITNKDKPGLIGALGTMLGDAGVNIASFHLGRAESGGDAIALIEVDQDIPAALLAKVASLEHVIQAKALKF